MTENDNKQDFEKIENLLRQTGEELNESEVDPKFLNKLKYKLKDEFHENQQKSSQGIWGWMSWHRGPVLGAIVTGVVLITVVFQTGTVGDTEIQLEPGAASNSYSIDEPKAEPAPKDEIKKTYSKAEKVEEVDKLEKPPAKMTVAAPAITSKEESEDTFAAVSDEAVDDEGTSEQFAIAVWTNSLEEAEKQLTKELSKIEHITEGRYSVENSLAIYISTSATNAERLTKAIEANPNNVIYTVKEDFYKFAKEQKEQEEQEVLHVQILFSIKQW